MTIPAPKVPAPDVLSPETGCRLDVPGCVAEAGIPPDEA
ncbi:hypothetical protein SAMN05444164_1480 [Bradyrhizobium erythrophlei]|uniref:Uncharacterized protein n=1 Tax=Bradyrhizobium erythrophlei TaxID=1437360 RepID=A0A1H4RB23_9BRAD|nr:hypothetical protein SAMN05444164_1480 [Bradyrhizobium erythrophlei]